MKARLLLNVVLAILATILGVSLWLKPTPRHPVYILSSIDPAAVTQIQLQRQHQPRLVLDKTSGVWHVSHPFKARGDALKIAHLLGLLSATASQRLSATDLGRFGLATPTARLTLNHQTFRFGTINPLTQQLYVATGDYVYLIAPQYAADVYSKSFDFAAKNLFGPGEEPVGFVLPGLTLIRNKKGNWHVTPPRPRLTADQLNAWADNWTQASALLSQPYVTGTRLGTIKVSLTSGRVITLAVLQRQPEFILLRQDENMQYDFPAASGKRLLNP